MYIVTLDDYCTVFPLLLHRYFMLRHRCVKLKYMTFACNLLFCIYLVGSDPPTCITSITQPVLLYNLTTQLSLLYNLIRQPVLIYNLIKLVSKEVQTIRLRVYSQCTVKTGQQFTHRFISFIWAHIQLHPPVHACSWVI